MCAKKTFPDDPTGTESKQKVRFPSAEACLGDVISPTQVYVEPRVMFDKMRPGTNYTIIMIDPDLPSAHAPLLRNYLLLLKINVYMRSTGFQSGTTIADYIAPTPYPGSRYHRYVILVYEQNSPLDVEAVKLLRLSVQRYRYDVVAFARRFGLGQPVAGNFFRVKIPAIIDEYYCKKSGNSQTCGLLD